MPLLPGPDHPIDVAPFSGRVTVTAGGRTIAESTAALELREASYPPVMYVPLTDIEPGVLRPSETTTHCPYKGDASYYDVIDPAGAGQTISDAVWHYRKPYPAVSQIAQHVAFYPDRVQIDVQPAG